MKKLPPQPHKPRYYVFEVSPTFTVGPEGMTNKFVCVCRELSGLPMLGTQPELREITTWISEQEFDEPNTAAHELFVDMGNALKFRD